MTADKITSMFTSTPGVYAIVGTHLDIEDQLNARILQLEAMLNVTSGEQGETFRMLSDVIQDNYMWACSSAIREIKQLRKVIQAKNDAEQSEGEAE